MNVSPPRPDRRQRPVRGGRPPHRLRPLSVLALLGGWPRRLLATSLLLLAAVVWLRGPTAPASGAADQVAVLAAAHDLGAGAVLQTTDIRLVRLDATVVPAGALRSPQLALGRTVAGAVRRGEPITDVRLVGPGLTSGLRQPEAVAVPVRLADSETAALLRAGDRVDLLATAASGMEPPTDLPRAQSVASAVDAVAVVTGVRVLAVLARSDTATEAGVVVVVATTDAAARRLAGTAAHARLSVAMRPP
jgi:pilus assembly protein CpaB